MKEVNKILNVLKGKQIDVEIGYSSSILYIEKNEVTTFVF